MLTFLFNLCLLTIFILESIFLFVLNSVLEYKNGEDIHKTAFHIITGLIVRGYMLMYLLEGMGILKYVKWF